MTPKSFDRADQEEFARISGDHNPVHVDPIAARRTLFGRPIVHGVHALVWAIDSAIRDVADVEGRVLRRIRVVFKRAIGVGENVSLKVTPVAGPTTRLVLETTGSPAARIRLEWGPGNGDAGVAIRDATPDSTDCRSLQLDEMAGRSGWLELALPGGARDRFPNLWRVMRTDQIATLVATSRLVGMECPGLHSIYSELHVDFDEDGESDARLVWRVDKADARVSLVSLSGSGPGTCFRLRAFVRPMAPQQASFQAARDRVEPDEFSDQRALVVGGSRGLGEVVAKLLAAGGARVLLTHRQGRQDAERVKAEILAGGGRAETMYLDVLDSTPPEIPSEWSPTHLYYFATPPILAASADTFNGELFDHFSRFYVAGFVRLIEHVRASHRRLSMIYYPSSVYVDEPPPAMAEYAAAKAAGETACAVLERRFVGMRVVRTRLPRLETDQTASVTRAENADPLPEMLRRLRDIAAPSLDDARRDD